MRFLPESLCPAAAVCRAAVDTGPRGAAERRPAAEEDGTEIRKIPYLRVPYFLFLSAPIGESKMRVLRSLMLLVLAVIAAAAGSAGQLGPFPYASGKNPFPNPGAPFTPSSVPNPSYTNSPRIGELLKDGKLKLSLDDAIALALENNLDLAIFRYNLPIADTDILRTKAGASIQGVNNGILQGTPGGGSIAAAGASGGGPGGTSVAAGGAGSGAGGIVISSLGSGPPVDTFDPMITAGLNLDHATLPQSVSYTTGSLSLKQNTGNANFAYQQAFPSGTQFSVAFDNNRVVNNDLFDVLNPALSSTLSFSFRQHLLQGLSVPSNRRFMRIARNNREISDVALRLQVITTVTQIENMYWTLVAANEDVKAKQRALDLANRLLTDNQKQVEIGTLAPIEVVRAQSNVASASQDLIVAQTNLQLQQLLMKNAISRNLTDAQLMAADVFPTDTMQLPETEPVVPTDDLITDALAHRPELAESNINLTNAEITNQATRNNLLPSIDLVGRYGTAALGGPITQLASLVGPCPANPLATTSSLCVPAGLQSTGYGHTFSNLFSTQNPDYMVGVNVNIPIRNRAAQATQIRAQLEYRQAQMRVQQQQNQIRIEVRNAQIGVQQNRARVEAARKGRELAYETMDAEQKKYALGASTTYNVLQTQQALSAAESNLIAAMAAYESSKVEMDRATGLMLTNLGIELADAESGNVTHLPHVPDVVPAGK
jgi:outer membrane protein TolC